MFPEEEGVESGGIPVVESPRTLFTGVPHFPQNSLSGGTGIAHDGQSLIGSLPAQVSYRGKLLPQL
jgi:hypothetical protein